MTRTFRRLALLGAFALPFVVPVATRGAGPASAGKLEIASWWTSGSEAPALGVLIDAFKQADPGVDVDNASVRGGAGSNVQILLAKRLREGDPPDVWQTFLGSSLTVYARYDDVADVSAIFDRTRLGATMIPAALDAATWRGRQWGVPTGAHRGNMLWFDPALLARAGVARPTAAYDDATFLADLAALKAHGVTPLCLGAKDRFTIAELFENILVDVVGTRGWSDIAEDRFDWQGPQLHQALDRLGRILRYADPDADALTWDQAAKRLATGKCAFLSMNDSVYGELVADGVAPADIGSVAYPGTDHAFLAIIDTFVVARNAEDSANAMAFLSTIASPSTELAFARIKGSVPLRRDVDLSSLPPYQRSAFQALTADPMLLSIAHGELLSPRFNQALYDGVSAFARDHDPASFTARIDQAETQLIPGGF